MSVVGNWVVSISALEHHEYCPRQCALIHVDGVWAENRHTVAGTRAHRRVDSGEHRHERGRLVLRSIPLWSEHFGLSGRADAVEIVASETVVPVEYKSGVRHGRAADLQLCAQALCLEEMFGVSVPSGAVWYGGTRRREVVRLDDELRHATLDAVKEIRWSLKSPRLLLTSVATRASFRITAFPRSWRGLLTWPPGSIGSSSDEISEHRLRDGPRCSGVSVEGFCDRGDAELRGADPDARY